MTPADILDLIRNASAPMTKRDIARAFGAKGSGVRIALKHMLKDLEHEGLISKTGGAYTIPDGLPSVCVVEVSDIDIDGDVFARPVEWNEETQGPPPRIEIMPDNKGHPSLGLKDRALVRLKRISGESYEARTIKRLDAPENRIMGLLSVTKSGAGFVQSTDKKDRHEFEIDPQDIGKAKDGDLVVAEIQPSRNLKRKKARIVDVIGKRDDPKAISLISIYEAGMREEFPKDVLSATKGLKVPPLKGREDLRDIPLVTIDGADARDFDDAVWAEKTQDGGYHILVAIADVAHYVRPESALDKEAQRRGNSTYFPDRVVPMLPEALSNDLCSLRPNENRACMAMHMWIDDEGKLIKYRIVRGIMRSAARLIYEDVQKAYDTGKHEFIDLIKPLYKAFQILDKARQKRGALELDLPEKQILIDDKGNMTGVKQRERLDAHRMIEEFMVLANVAAALCLEKRKSPCVYRVHDRPSMEKLDSAREFLQSFDLSLPKGQVIRGGQINNILHKAKKLPYSHLISTVLLRCQSQAVYSAENIGHFGLALTRYAHFTSPIRRYADLLVHRSLINAYGLGGDGLYQGEEARLEELCQHISTTERTSMVAERTAIDRFTAAYLSEKIGARFEGRITGVTRFGLFVELNESGADGLVPMKSLDDDFYVHDEQAHALIGRRRGKIFMLGAAVTVELMEADGLTGSTVLKLVDHEKGAVVPGVQLKKRNPLPKNLKASGGRGSAKPAHKGKKKKKTTPKHKRKPKKPYRKS